MYIRVWLYLCWGRVRGLGEGGLTLLVAEVQHDEPGHQEQQQWPAERLGFRFLCRLRRAHFFPRPPRSKARDTPWTLGDLDGAWQCNAREGSRVLLWHSTAQRRGGKGDKQGPGEVKHSVLCWVATCVVSGSLFPCTAPAGEECQRLGSRAHDPI